MRVDASSLGRISPAHTPAAWPNKHTIGHAAPTYIAGIDRYMTHRQAGLSLFLFPGYISFASFLVFVFQLYIKFT